MTLKVIDNQWGRLS